jgi:hypothetical protein
MYFLPPYLPTSLPPCLPTSLPPYLPYFLTSCCPLHLCVVDFGMQSTDDEFERFADRYPAHTIYLATDNGQTQRRFVERYGATRLRVYSPIDETRNWRDEDSSLRLTSLHSAVVDMFVCVRTFPEEVQLGTFNLLVPWPLLANVPSAILGFLTVPSSILGSSRSRRLQRLQLLLLLRRHFSLADVRSHHPCGR